MKKTGLKSIFSLALTMILIFSVLPLSVAATDKTSVVSRDDGVWLFPLEKGYYNKFTDWAGCPGCDSCPFHGVRHVAWEDDFHSGQGGHNGIDIDTPIGTPVYAAATGILYWQGAANGGRGSTVIIEHPLENGYSYYSYYQHLSKTGIVAKGGSVVAGTKIAESGNSGIGSGAHLHFGIVMGKASNGKAITDGNAFLSGIESKGWLKTETGMEGRILNNPALTNDAGFPTGLTSPYDVLSPLKAHCGSVHYTFDKSKVNIGAGAKSEIDIVDIAEGEYLLRCDDAYLNASQDWNGGNVYVVAHNNELAQRWVVVKDNDVYIVASANGEGGRVLNVATEGVSAAGLNATLWSLDNHPTQRWVFEEISGGYRIHPSDNNSVTLMVMDDKNVMLSANANTGNQIWKLEPVQDGQRQNDILPLSPKIDDDVIAGVPTQRLAIQSNGSLWAWGWNRGGQIGNGTNEDCLTPIKIMDDVKNVYAQAYYSMAIKRDNSLWAWGANSQKGIGDGTTEIRYEPVKILDDVISVSSCGGSHSMAVKSDGSLWAWGDNSNGMIGDGTTQPRYKPVKIMDDVVQVSASFENSAALKSDGTLWMWGSNSDGRIGDGSTIDQYNPVKIMDGVKSIYSFTGYILAIKFDDSLWGWGVSDFLCYSYSPLRILPNTTTPMKIADDVVQVIDAYIDHIMYLKKDASVWTLGWRGYNASDKKVFGEFSTTSIMIMDNVAYANSYTAIRTDGSLWAWEWGGLDNQWSKKLMDDVVYTTDLMAVKKDGSLWTWGHNLYGEIGDGTTIERDVPVKIMENIKTNNMSVESASNISAWADNDVHRAIELNIVPQALQNNYTAPTTRAEFCAMAVSLYESVSGREIAERRKFADTNDMNVWKMGGLGVVNGIGDDKFSPNGAITREQAAVILANLAESMGASLTLKQSEFVDNNNISSWAILAVGQMQATGIMSGTGNNTFAPKADYTREQSIVTLLRLYDFVNRELDSYAAKVLELTNIERVKAGLPALSTNTLLRKAASIRAKELENSLSHSRPNGKECYTVLEENGVFYMSVGENIASGQIDAGQVVEAWMNSAGHRANILDNDFNKIGVGVYVGSNNDFYWVQIFTD